jgi:hypothetical protein
MFCFLIHCVSSRVDNADEIYCVSLYLKSDNVGKNDNSIEITVDEEKLVDYHCCSNC